MLTLSNPPGTILVAFPQAACHRSIGIVNEPFDFGVLDGVVGSSPSMRGARSNRIVSSRSLEPKPPPLVVPVTRGCMMNRHRLTIRENVSTKAPAQHVDCADPGKSLTAACHRRIGIDDRVFDSDVRVNGSSSSVCGARCRRIV